MELDPSELAVRLFDRRGYNAFSILLPETSSDLLAWKESTVFNRSTDPITERTRDQLNVGY
jgi:hypothetical protein